MFCAVQIPIADSRLFIATPTGRLATPTWPLASPSGEFLRGTGPIRHRRRGGVEAWPGEDVYCDIASAIRFSDRLEHSNSGIETQCVFRRLYSDGIVSRAVVGLRTKRISLDGSQFHELVWDWLNLQMRISQAGGSVRTSRLQRSGNLLASHLLRASTSRLQNRDDPCGWWVTPGDIQVFVEYNEKELAGLPPHCRILEQIKGRGWQLGYWRIYAGHCPIGIWLLGRHSDVADPDELRRLRIHLFRVHAEREVLRVVLRLLAQKKLSVEVGTEASDALQRYLRDAVQMLKKGRRLGFSQSAVLDTAHRCTELVNPGAMASLNQQLSAARHNVSATVSRYTQAELLRHSAKAPIYNLNGDIKMTTITISDIQVDGNFNVAVAERIENSFNNTMSTDVSDDLKTAIKNLGVEVANLARELPEEQAEQVSRDFEVLALEAVAKNPRQKWYELSADGLIEAARTVAAMTGPLTTAVQAVLALLAL